MKSVRLAQSNRVNALKSTGPRSAAGKDAVSCNALKTGLYAKKLIILGEDPADFESLQQENYQFHLPATPEERFHLDAMIRCEWQTRRLDTVEAQLWEYSLQEIPQDTPVECALGKIYFDADTAFSRLERQRSTLHRTYREASTELAALKSARFEIEQAALEAEQAAAAAIVAMEAVIPDAGGAGDLVAGVFASTGCRPGVPPELSPEAPLPAPQPVETEATSPQIGFVPSDLPQAVAGPAPADPDAGLSDSDAYIHRRARQLAALRARPREESAANSGPVPFKTAS